MGPTRDVLAIVQAGGQGSRMDVLTRERPKPALPFGGHYQLIDFPLSSLAHSGIRDVWIAVQYQAMSLGDHIASGRPWDLDRTVGGLRWVVPEEGHTPSDGGFAQGNADQLASRVDDLRRVNADVVVVLSADSLWTLDLAEVIAEHREGNASCTVVTVEATSEQAAAKAVLHVRDGGVIERLDYKPEQPATTTIAAEIFVYDRDDLVAALEELRHVDHDGEAHTGLGDFGERLLPHLIDQGRVRAFALDGYWRDMGSPEEYLRGHRDLIAGRTDGLFRDEWPILSRFPELVPARIQAGAVVSDSLLSAGCDVRGTVRRSVLGPGVIVDEGAVVEDCVIMARTVIEGDARVASSIVDAHCVIGRGATVGELTEEPNADDIVLMGRDCRIAPGTYVTPGGRLEPGSVT